MDIKDAYIGQKVVVKNTDSWMNGIQGTIRAITTSKTNREHELNWATINVKESEKATINVDFEHLVPDIPEVIPRSYTAKCQICKSPCQKSKAITLCSNKSCKSRKAIKHMWSRMHVVEPKKRVDKNGFILCNECDNYMRHHTMVSNKVVVECDKGHGYEHYEPQDFDKFVSIMLTLKTYYIEFFDGKWNALTIKNDKLSLGT